jgi:hypothetical protein
MIKEQVLFGIDAADCSFHTPLLHNCWQQFLDHYQTHDPTCVPVLLEIMQRIAHHPELPDLIEREIVQAPGPVLQNPIHDYQSYSDNTRAIHDELLRTLREQAR